MTHGGRFACLICDATVVQRHDKKIIIFCRRRMVWVDEQKVLSRDCRPRSAVRRIQDTATPQEGTSAIDHAKHTGSAEP